MRELEERHVVIIPIIDNCKVPLFMREKLFADFRKSFDVGFKSYYDLFLEMLESSRNDRMNIKN